MGKVRPAYIKRVGRMLMEQYPDRFTEDFEHNKQVVGQLVEGVSKKVRNRIAGYITSQVKRIKTAGEEEEVEESESVKTSSEGGS
ncbi:30S ribosomal protein S17e [Caldivirga maquilingensis]|nr:30S ribosomal protein S17e [Caldivirga maquilingensis]